MLTTAVIKRGVLLLEPVLPVLDANKLFSWPPSSLCVVTGDVAEHTACSVCCPSLYMLHHTARFPPHTKLVEVRGAEGY